MTRRSWPIRAVATLGASVLVGAVIGGVSLRFWPGVVGQAMAAIGLPIESDTPFEGEQTTLLLPSADRLSEALDTYVTRSTPVAGFDIDTTYPAQVRTGLSEEARSDLPDARDARSTVSVLTGQVRLRNSAVQYGSRQDAQNAFQQITGAQPGDETQTSSYVAEAGEVDDGSTHQWGAVLVDNAVVFTDRETPADEDSDEDSWSTSAAAAPAEVDLDAVVAALEQTAQEAREQVTSQTNVPTASSEPVDAVAVATELMTETDSCAECSVTGQITYQADGHSGTAVSFGADYSQSTSGSYSPAEQVGIVLVADDGSIDWWGADAGRLLYGYHVLAQDSTGNIFIAYNPGRYNGVQVLIPSRGFGGYSFTADQAATYAPTYAAGFYSAEAEDSDGDGEYEIHESINTCDPMCASGNYVDATYTWDGEWYVKQ